jgi:superfamily I DNA/RNA helicase
MQQAAFIAQRVLELRDEGVNLNQVAVLYRSHFHALELQLELTKRNIPFSITSGIRFFEQAHIKDATAYLKLVANPRDEIAFKRLAQLLPGIAARARIKSGRFFPRRWKIEDRRWPFRQKRQPPGHSSSPPFPNWKTPRPGKAPRRCCGW